MGRAIVVFLITGLSLALGAWLVFHRGLPQLPGEWTAASAGGAPAFAGGAPPPPHSVESGEGLAPPAGRLPDAGADAGLADGGAPPPEVAVHPLTEALCRPGSLLIEPETPQLRRFCIDRFEYPNLEGVVPATMVTFEQARDACREEGKRLCTDVEWAEACESGPPRSTRRACNIGSTRVDLAPSRLWDPVRVSERLEGIDGRTASGSLKRCVTRDGVYDMPGNVAEWVEPSAWGTHRSALRGGHFADETSTCRTAQHLTARHYRFFQTGFRCCNDPILAPILETGKRSAPTSVPSASGRLP